MVLFLPAACGPGTVPLMECRDESTLHVCDDEGCRDVACRADQLCDRAACRRWYDVPLSADFDLESDPADPRRFTARVRPGGFPRLFAEQIRFTFGDGVAGWGEEIAHRYRKPGAYPVELEVRLEGYRILRASRDAVVAPVPDDWDPLTLTVNDIRVEMNGSVPYLSTNDTPDPADDYLRGFTLLLPDRGFTVDLRIAAPPDARIVRESLRLVADRPLGGGRVPPGTDLSGRLVEDVGPSLRTLHASWLAGAEDAFPPGRTTLTLRARDTRDRHHSASVPIEIVPLSDDNTPFAKPYAWLLRFGQDLYTVTGSTADTGLVRLEATLGPDGQPDFVQEMRILGVQGNESAPGARTVAAGGRTGANAICLARVQAEIMREIRTLYHMAPDGTPRDGIGFELFSEGWPGAPDPASYRPDGDFSMIRLGGELDGGYFGMSRLSWWAQSRVDDTEDDLGVGTVAIDRALFGTAIIGDAFNDVKPGVGTPVGEHALDALVLSDSFDRWAPGNSEEANARRDALDRVVRFMGLAIGAVTAHEMGHAMGLVPDGVPPEGLFANVTDCPFIGSHTDLAHADFPGLNLMQAGGNLFGVIAEFTSTTELPRDLDAVALGRLALEEERLAPYERAYFRRALTYRR